MTTIPLAELLTEAQAIAIEAGQRILEVYRREFSVAQKPDNTPLTDADMAAHHYITKNLSQLEHPFPILSEESEDIAFNERKQWETYWLVDPLDGTKEFVKRSGEFTVNISLISNHESVLGVVYTPVKGWMHFAHKDGGAFFQASPTAMAEPITTAPCSPTETIMVAGSRSHGAEKVQKLMSIFNNAKLRSMGSSLKMCMVASGEADIYPRFGPTSEWDTAAAHCIISEAGGEIYSLDMQPLKYNTKASLRNPEFIAVGDKTIHWKQFIDKVNA